MNLLKAETLAKNEIKRCEELGLILPNIWRFSWNKRKRAFGVCSYSKNEIQLSSIITLYESEEKVLDTIRHELAHAVAGYKEGHGKVWKRYAILLGADPKSSHEACEEVHKNVKPSFVMVDTTINKIVQKYHRKPNPSTYATVSERYIEGRLNETLGKLVIMPMERFERLA